MKNHSRWSGLVLLLVVIVFFCVSNLVWILQDQSRSPYGDTYAYLTKVVKFVDRFDLQVLQDPWQAIVKLSLASRPPLYAILTLPFVALFGPSEDAATLLNVLLLALLMFSVYHAGKLIKNEEAGLLAALTVASYPPIAGVVRIYLPHSAVPACTALSLWLLLLLLKTRSVRVAWAFGASLAFGILIHPSFLWYWGVPPIVFGFYMLLFQKEPRRPVDVRGFLSWLLEKVRDRFAILGLVPAALMPLLLGSAWYLTQGDRLFRLRKNLLSPELADFRGMKDPSFWTHALTVPAKISLVMSFFVMAGLIYGLCQRRAANWVPVVGAVAGYTLYITEVATVSWHYFAAILPFFAVLTAVCIVGIRHQLLRNSFAAICICTSVINFTVVTWGVWPWSRPLALALGARLESCPRQSMALCVSPARAEFNTGFNAVAQRAFELIFEDRKCRSKPACKLLFSSGGPSNLMYSLAKNWPAEKLTILTDGVPNWGRYYLLANLLDSDYILYYDAVAANLSYQQATLEFLESPPEVFAAAHQVVGSLGSVRGAEAILIKRIRPLGVEEAEATIAALNLPEEHKVQKYQLLPRLYSAEGQWAKALAYNAEGLRTVPDHWPGLRSRIDAARLNILMKTVRDLTKRGQVDHLAAIAAELESKIASAPDQKKSTQVLTQALGALASTYRKTGKEEEAIAELEKALTLAPGQMELRRMLAEIHRSLGNATEAIKFYQEAVDLKPTHADTRIRLAMVYREANRREDAVAELKKAISLAPDRMWPRRMLADTYLPLGKVAEAIAIYKEILALDPTYVDAHIGLAMAHRQCKKKEDAMAELEKAISSAPHRLRPRRMLADIYLSLRRTPEAIAMYKVILDMKPAYVDARIGLAMAYRQSQRVEDAITELETAISLAPHRLRPRRVLLGILESLNRNEGAIAICREILELDPTDKVAQNALRRLSARISNST